MTGSITVLHVDDEPGFADLTSDFLERESDHIDVRTETSAQAALETIQNQDPDCVVSDHDMGDISGIELLKLLREDHPDLPFILFTGKGSEEVASKAVSAGVTEYLQKESGTDHYTLLANRIENVVERRRSRKAVQDQKNRLDRLVSNLPGIVYRCDDDPKWPMQEVEGECQQLSGYSAEQLENGDVTWGEDIIHPEDQETVYTEVQEAIANREAFQCTYRIKTAEDETKWVWERGRGVIGDSGEITALEGFITDITEDKRRERRFEAIFNNTYQFTGLCEPDGTIIEANETALSFAGINREDVIGKPLWEGPWFQSGHVARSAAREAVETARNGELYRREIRAQGADKEETVDLSVRPVTNKSGDVTLLIPEGRTISTLKGREQTLRKKERLFGAIFNDPNLLVAQLNVDGVVEDVNETAIEYIDKNRDDIVDQPFTETPWWNHAHETDVKEWVERAAEGEYVEYEAVHPSGDSTKTFVEGSFRPVTNDDGDVENIVVSAKDITQRKQQEKALKQRNERFDEFASFVSHDLQTPISTVVGRLQLALETEEMDHVERAADAIDRVDALRDDLVHSLRTGEIVSNTKPVKVVDVVSDVWGAVDPPSTVSASVEDTLEIDADRDAFQRLLENLVGNSVVHGTGDSQIQIGEFDCGFYYEDDGPGIDPTQREQVFTPGYSTKTGDEGIGMGMASVRQIVLAHDWEINIEEAQILDGVRFEITTQ